MNLTRCGRVIGNLRVRSALALGLFFASLCLSQKAHPDWRRGELVAINIFHALNPLERDWARESYEYTLDDGETLYIADFGARPLKSALHDPIQFTVQKEKLVVTRVKSSASGQFGRVF